MDHFGTIELQLPGITWRGFQNRAVETEVSMRKDVVLLGFALLLAAVDVEAFQLSTEFRPVEDRLRKGEKSEPVVAQVARCSEARRELRITSDTFPMTYPDGLFVVCDTSASKNAADATVLRYLFNASKKEVLVASAIDVKLSKAFEGWKIHSWQESFFEYAP